MRLGGSVSDAEMSRRLRRHNFFATNEDFFPIHQWPPYLRSYAVAPHLNNYDRFRFFYFFVANGVAPELACEWVLATDFVDGRHVEGSYDAAALSQMHNLVGRALDRSLFVYDYFDMVEGRVQRLKNFQ